MFIVAKTIKGKEFLRSKTYSILCNNKKQAEKLAKFLTENNEHNCNEWKLKDGEIYRAYEIDSYDAQPLYRLKSTKNKISIVYNY